MRNMLFIICTAGGVFLFGGCVSSGPAPQDVRLLNPDGKSVIIKDLSELPLIENRKLKETEIVKVFFPQTDNIMMRCSITLLKIPPGVSPPKYRQSSAQIIYAISGGGKLLVNSSMIILKKGIMVYVPPNVPMLITNNVNRILEIIVVTSPPFEPSHMEVLEDSLPKVKVAKDPEDELNNAAAGQDVSEKYQADTKKRSLSIEEYRKKINKTMPPANAKDPVIVPEANDKDPVSELLDEADKDKKTSVRDTWPLRMPDDSQEPLDKLKEDQEEKLIPPTPQNLKDTSTKDVQELTPAEHKVPLPAETGTAAPEPTKAEKDSLENLLKDQEEQVKKLAPPKESTAKVKKTSLEHIQELSPEEHGGTVYKKAADTAVGSLEKMLKDQEKQREKLLPKEPAKADKTSLKHIQELSPEEHGVSGTANEGKVEESTAESDEDPLEKMLKDQKRQQENPLPDKTLKVKKTSLKNIQELSPEENAVKTKSDKEP